MQQRAARYLTLMLYAAFGLLALWVFVKFLLPWTAPFILAYAAAAMLERPVRLLIRYGWRRGAAAGMLTLGVLVLLSAGVGAATVKGAGAVTALAWRGPELIAELGARTAAIEVRLNAALAQAPAGISEYVAQAVEGLLQEFYEAPALVMQRLPDVIARIAQAGPDTLLFIVTAALGTYMISASYPRTNAFIMAQLPPPLRRRIEGIGTDLRASFGGYVRAQLILMGITFFELSAAFLLMSIKSAIPLAALTALVDALPVFGTGTVLVPWAIYELLLGDTGRAVLLALLWGGVNLVRSCVQAKLLGDQIGLSPLASLAALYIGWRVWHVLGMLLFPILLATLSQLNDRGLIRLWKSV